MLKLGIKEKEYLEMDPDDINAFVYLYQCEEVIRWEKLYEFAVKIIGGK